MGVGQVPGACLQIGAGRRIFLFWGRDSGTTANRSKKGPEIGKWIRAPKLRLPGKEGPISEAMFPISGRTAVEL